jgi:hypothetical protein
LAKEWKKITLEIILTKTKKVVFTGNDNSRMRNPTFFIKNVKIYSELTCATSALVLSVTWAGAKLSQWDCTSHKT